MNVLKPHLQTTLTTLLEKGTSHRQIERMNELLTPNRGGRAFMCLLGEAKGELSGLPQSSGSDSMPGRLDSSSQGINSVNGRSGCGFFMLALFGRSLVFGNAGVLPDGQLSRRTHHQSLNAFWFTVGAFQHLLQHWCKLAPWGQSFRSVQKRSDALRQSPRPPPSPAPAAAPVQLLLPADRAGICIYAECA